MKLESIDFWLIVLYVSVFLSFWLSNYGFGNMLYSLPRLKCPLNSSSELKKNQIRKFFCSENFVLLDIKSVHGQPDSPI